MTKKKPTIEELEKRITGVGNRLYWVFIIMVIGFLLIGLHIIFRPNPNLTALMEAEGWHLDCLEWEENKIEIPCRYEPIMAECITPDCICSVTECEIKCYETEKSCPPGKGVWVR